MATPTAFETHDISELKELADALFTDDVPVSCLLDDHPASDRYLRDIEKLKREIIRQSDTMRPNQIRQVKLKHQGYSNSVIAEKLDKSPSSVSSTLAQPACKKLLALLRYLSMALDGPMEAQRRAMLWRIADRNEEEDPRCAISAIAELNKMDNNALQLEAMKSAGTGSGRVEIIVQSPALVRTVLDE